MKTLLIAIALLLSIPVQAQTPQCPDTHRPCGNICCPK